MLCSGTLLDTLLFLYSLQRYIDIFIMFPPKLRKNRQHYCDAWYKGILPVGLLMLVTRVSGFVQPTEFKYDRPQPALVPSKLGPEHTDIAIKILQPVNPSYISSNIPRPREELERSCKSNSNCPWSFICVDGICVQGCETSRDCVEPQYCGDKKRCMIRYPPWHPGGDTTCLDRWQECWFTAQCCSGWCRQTAGTPDFEFRCDMERA